MLQLSHTPRNDFCPTHDRIFQAANRIYYEAAPCSVTKHDFCPEALMQRPMADSSCKSTGESHDQQIASATHSKKIPSYENFNYSLFPPTNTTFGRVMPLVKSTTLPNENSISEHNRIECPCTRQNPRKKINYIEKYSENHQEDSGLLKYLETTLADEFQKKRIPFFGDLEENPIVSKSLSKTDYVPKKVEFCPTAKELPTTMVDVECAIPKWTPNLENVSHNVLSYGYTKSSAPPVSETREEMQKTRNLFHVQNAAGVKLPDVAKTKPMSNFDGTLRGAEVPFTNEYYPMSDSLLWTTPVPCTSGMKSVTRADFQARGFVSQTAAEASEPKTYKFRKGLSRFSDLSCPRREGIYTFLDDSNYLLENRSYEK